MGKRWTQADIDAHQAKRGIPPGNITAPQAEPQKKRVITPTKEAPELAEMKAWLRILKIDYTPELVFHPTRKWRFDISIPAHMLAIEYEGIFGENSGHTTLGGYIKDCQKYNAATVLGWRVLRYTSNNYQEFMKDITDLLNIKEV